MLSDLIALFYPQSCCACGNTLYKRESVLCNACIVHLPRTNFHLEKENAITKLFWGRVTVYSATSLFYFNKGNRVQNLLHQLKYKGRQDVGVKTGNLLGSLLKENENFSSVDVIIPIPLHEKKLKKRGYNQSECFAMGLSETFAKTVDVKSVQRASESETQTKKSKFSRWKNVENIFEIYDENSLKNKHILLVDDVITTGATLEACAQKILAIEGTTVSIASIACA